MTRPANTLTRAERYFWRTTTLLAVACLLVGLGFIFDAPANSTSFDVAKTIMPLEAWGLFPLAGAVLYFMGLFSYNRNLLLAGLSVGGFFTMAFALTFVMAAITGVLAGFTSIIWWGVIGVMHLFAVFAMPSTLQIQRLKDDKRGI